MYSKVGDLSRTQIKENKRHRCSEFEMATVFDGSLVSLPPPFSCLKGYLSKPPGSKSPVSMDLWPASVFLITKEYIKITRTNLSHVKEERRQLTRIHLPGSLKSSRRRKQMKRFSRRGLRVLDLSSKLEKTPGIISEKIPAQSQSMLLWKPIPAHSSYSKEIYSQGHGRRL